MTNTSLPHFFSRGSLKERTPVLKIQCIASSRQTSWSGFGEGALRIFTKRSRASLHSTPPYSSLRSRECRKSFLRSCKNSNPNLLGDSSRKGPSLPRSSLDRPCLRSSAKINENRFYLYYRFVRLTMWAFRWQIPSRNFLEKSPQCGLPSGLRCDWSVGLVWE